MGRRDVRVFDTYIIILGEASNGVGCAKVCRIAGARARLLLGITGAM